MKEKRKFPIITIIIILVIAALGYGGYYYWKNNPDDKAKFQTAPVTRGDLTQTVTASGQLNPVVTVQVGSQISGNIKILNADFNSSVKKGDIVAELDPSTFEANVLQASGELANAKAALNLARIQKERTEALYSKDAAPKSSLDQAIAALQQAEAAVQIKEGTLRQAQINLERCKIYSPIDGTVISRNVDVGQTVAASLSAPVLFTIANDLSKMQIDTNVSEADIGNASVDQEVFFTVDAFPSQLFRGKVKQIRNSPINSQGVISYDTIIEVNNAELKLKPGMTASVNIVIAKKKDVLTVKNAALRVRMPEEIAKPTPKQPSTESTSNTAPVSASSTNAVASASEGRQGGGRGSGEGRRGGGGSGGGMGGRFGVRKKTEQTVWVLNDAEPDAIPKSVTVKTGITDGISTEIMEGLQEGDKVVVSVEAPAKSNSSTSNPFSGAGGQRGGPGGGPRRF